ncbi:uncharacterized protein LOC111399148 isoform X1 [Olea europaea subsp. europaea]|uniref:Uncharacterized protein LOC111399148 isoform X1 n=2 Tax=Olea europaea subsp. europaea TaxID=158383 RepID=A0A8S0Q7D3_OLEEU|nr:uncharacterized protein LOC111399148 isoform X1 [Olea europaea subsp. europaea]
MTRHKERTLENLYNVTHALSQPEITPVLSGTFRMQGPHDEADYDSQLNMVSQSDKDLSSCSDKSQKVNIREKSGTCNVCSAPCSSCLHNYQVMMGTKTDNFSGDSCTENAVIDTGRRFETGQHSETSNVVGIKSEVDSFSENAVGKATSRTCDASEDTVTLPKNAGVKFLEGHDDNLSCISAANEAIVCSNGVRNGDGTDIPWSFASTCCPVEKSEYTIGYQTSSQPMGKCNVEDGMIQTSRQSKICGEFSDKVPPSSSTTSPSSPNLSLMEIPLTSTGNSSELVKVENKLLQSSNGKPLSVDADLMKLEKDLCPLPQGEQLECSHDQLNSTSMKDVVSDVICDNPHGGAQNSIKKNEDMEMEAHPSDENDNSDIEELDVKVCDICGDAGREDLLAVCSRCSDGAEHTYCMQETLTKVPEGNWLCEECKVEEQMSNRRQGKIEECKVEEQMSNRRQGKIGKIDGNEKNNSFGQASSENINSFDVEGNRTKGCSNMKTCGKRPRDENEVSSVAKKPAIESIMTSPRNSSSNKTAALSRENSFKNLDRGRMQPINHSSSATLPVNDTLESARTALDPRIQTSRGTFSKSHSFNSLNSKAKVKLVDQVFLRRLKSVREPASLHLKEGAVKSMGKSISFKSTNSVHSESKVKMISPRPTHIQDIKPRKERSSFEKKSSFKLERPSINSTIAKPTISMSNNHKKLGSLGESSSLTNRRETKAAQPDSGSMGLLKPSSFVARRNSDFPSSTGEYRRPSSYAQSTTGISSANMVSNFGQKVNQTVSKEDSSSCAGVAERPPCNTDEGLHDGLLQAREATNSGERMREHSGNRSWQGNTNGAVKFSRGENDNLKVAIEAAMLRKPGVHRKHRAWGQSDDSSVSSMNSEIACRDQLSSSGDKRNMSPAAEIIERHTVPSGLTADSLKQETRDTSKQSTLLPVEAPTSRGESVPFAPLDGKSSLGGISTRVSAAVPICLKSLAIPEHEYIWQGSFEVFRSGEILDLREGIQAHLSMCASPKVIEAVNKFNRRIILNEVPRLSTWPVQFQEVGVREDNIALFFFARDHESYEKSYKVLLENMMKNDLALKANLNGVELLIFPSNQLPENSQRWNMLFFLWGVFRGKKENCSHLPESSKQFSTPPDIPPAIMSLTENGCLLGPIAKDVSACDDVVQTPEVSASGKLWSLLSSKVVNGDCDTKVRSVDQLDDRLDSISFSTERCTSAKLCHEISGTFVEGDTDSIFTPEAESRASLQMTGSANGSTREQLLMQLDAASDRRQPSHYFDKSPSGIAVMAPGGITDERNIFDKMNSSRDQVKFQMNSDKESCLEENLDNNRWLMNHGKHLHNESKYVVPEGFYTDTSRAVPGNNSADVVLEKVSIDGQKNIDMCGSDAHDDQTSSCVDGFASLINCVGSGFSIQENGSADKSVIPERYFFPVDPHHVNGMSFVSKSMPWKMHLDVEDRLQDKVPDLELALGAERKALPQGIPPFLLGKVEKKIMEEHHFDKGASTADDDASASLSLSLSFPS